MTHNGNKLKHFITLNDVNNGYVLILTRKTGHSMSLFRTGLMTYKMSPFGLICQEE